MRFLEKGKYENGIGIANAMDQYLESEGMEVYLIVWDDLGGDGGGFKRELCLHAHARQSSYRLVCMHEGSFKSQYMEHMSM